MIRSILLVLVLVRAMLSFGQTPYGNEWIDHDRQYWRFDVFTDALHRIDSATLAAAGFPIGTVDPKDLMLFGREKQVPLYIEGGEDGVLNSGDFIEFHGRKNDGWIDSRMYQSPDQHANPYYSQFNDTIRYFLTWDPDVEVVKERIHPYVNSDYTPYTARTWVWGQGLRSNRNVYWLGDVYPGLSASNSQMIAGEGWAGAQLETSTNTVQANVPVTTERAFVGAGAPMADVEVVIAGQRRTTNTNVLDHHLQIWSGPGGTVLQLDTMYMGNKVIRSRFQVPASDLTTGFLAVAKIPHDLYDLGIHYDPQYVDRQIPAAATVRYARDLLSIGAIPVDIGIPTENDTISRLRISTLSGTPVLYAFGDTARRILPEFVGGAWAALVPTHPDSANTRSAVFVAESAVNVASLQPVSSDGYFTDYGDMDPDSALLIVTHHILWNGAQAYADYRSSGAPRPIPTVLADVDQLYDQFGGGVPKNSLAIRMWCKYVLETWTTVPQGLFLIGKSVTTSPVGYNQGTRVDVAGSYARCLVPTYGYPPSDQCFTMGLYFDPRRVEIPVGRLSASSEQQVFDYLDKVQTFEGLEHAAWMKNIVHLSGGFTEQEQTSLATYLRSMEPYAGDTTSFGAQYTRFQKRSSEIFSTAAADSVRQLIEGGVTLMNFFAHAYSESFDITLDDPDNYEWSGRYPMVIGNSCYIGNIHRNADLSTTSEDWVMRPGSGPIAFMASVDEGIAPYLATYSALWYKSLGTANYGKGIGEHMRYAGFENLATAYNTVTLYTVQTFTLQGDPMLVLNSPEKPDLEILPENILFDPASINADVDSFDVKVIVRNIGRIVNDPFGVQLERTNSGLPEPTVLTTQTTFGFQDTVVFRLATLAFEGGQGINQFNVRVDLDPDIIEEMDDIANNQASTTLFITSGDLVPTYPYNFAVVPEAGPELKASTGDPLAPVRSYIFQIDTTDLFNSPVMEMAVVNAPGGVVTWQPSTVYNVDLVQDSAVYFWRCSIDSTGNGGYNWYERSFQYIPGEQGWGQDHYFQFKNDDYSSMVYDRPDRDFEFSSAPHQINAWTPGFDYAGDIGWRLDLVNQDFGGCSAEAAWNVGIVDPYTYETWGTRWIDNSVDPPVEYNSDHNFGNQNDPSNSTCGRNRIFKYFTFRQNIPEQMTGLKNMIETVPDGHHMIFYTWLHINKTGMGLDPGLIPAMEAIGMPDINTLQDSVPYIFYVRKGFPGTLQDTIGTDIDSDLYLTAFIESSGDKGFITTMEAGPAQQWLGLSWEVDPWDANDSTVIQLKGVTIAGEEVDLGEFPATQGSVPDLWNYANAQFYPKLRLRGKFHDLLDADPKPGQLDRWHLLHVPVPECAIDPQLGYHQGLDGLVQGQEASIAVAVHNISEFDMDSLLMAAWVIDGSNTKRLVHYQRKAPLPAHAFQLDTIRFNTLPYGGANSLIVEANPVDTISGYYDQPEQYHFNNIAQWRFDVTEDRENPLLDVTFDGMHILDGDIVSARPEIEISLNDENTILLLDSPADTAQFKVILQRPGAPVERIYFRDGQGNENLQFIPADGPENEARIFYRPSFTADGKYLLTVQASDLSANASGDNDYKVSFEVINRTTITEVLNYPNPFTTSTRFVFTLTGSAVPTYMKIQIMTITGKVVREVKMHELGPLRVGKNMTEYAWDGTDEFGDRLARGVYLYRVIAQMNGEDIEYRATGASEYFTKGFGKMYLLR
jgi:hypothetical protein